MLRGGEGERETLDDALLRCMRTASLHSLKRHRAVGGMQDPPAPKNKVRLSSGLRSVAGRGNAAGVASGGGDAEGGVAGSLGDIGPFAEEPVDAARAVSDGPEPKVRRWITQHR